MKTTSLLKRIFSSPTSKNQKTKVFLSKERQWLLGPEDVKPEFVAEEHLSETEDFLKKSDFIVEYLGIPNQAFQSYKFLNQVEDVEYSVFKIKLLYKGDKNYIFHILNEAYQKNISDDMIIKIINSDNQVLNTITLKSARIHNIRLLDKLSRKKKGAIHAKVIFVHKSRTLN